MSSYDASAPEQEQPNKRIRLSEPIAKEGPGHGASAGQAASTRPTTSEHVQSLSSNPTRSAITSSTLGPKRLANDGSTPVPASGRVKLEDIAGAQQQPSPRPGSSQQTINSVKPIPSTIHRIPPSTGPSTPSPASAGGLARPNSMLPSHTSRYVYPAAATPMLSRTPSAGSGAVTPSGNNAPGLGQSTPQRIPHPLSSNITQNGQGRFVPSTAGLRTPQTPGTAFSTGSGSTPGMAGRSIMSTQPMSGRSFPPSATIPNSASRPATPGAGVLSNQQPALVHITRPRTVEDARTIRETEQL